VATQYRDRHQCDAAVVDAVLRAECHRQPDRQPALGAVAEQGGDCRFFTAAAQDIGRARVLRAIGARVGQAEHAAHHDGEGNRADQVGGDGKKQGIQHVVVSMS
jgi:hypothetical protein